LKERYLAANEIDRVLSEKGIDPTALQLLLDYGRRHGQLTRSEIIDMVPDAEFDNPLVEQLVNAISDAGIAYSDTQATMQEESEYPGEEEAMDLVATLASEVSEINLEGVEIDDVLRMYLRDAAGVPLLTYTQEVELARKIEQCRTAQEELARGQVTPARRRELERQIHEGQVARDHLVRANVRLVISVARRYSNRGIPLSDLIQEGNIGLMRAVRKYEYQRGFKFSTYATWWIRQAITRALADQSRTIRLPAYLSDQIGRMRRMQNQLQQQLGRTPTSVELAEVMGLDADKIERMLESVRQPLSLDSPVGEENETELGDIIEDTEAQNPEESATQNSLNDEMRRMLDQLPPREQEVLRLRFGLGTDEALTLSEVGRRMGVTRERARQLELQALERLRNPNARRRRRNPNA
jgi:RNA polymerase primary sigma factor